MGGGLSVSRSKRRVVRFLDKPDGGMVTLLGLQVLLEYGRKGSARPPVTAALIVANSLVYLRIGGLRNILPLNVDMAFNPYRIIEGGQWSRLLVSPLVHAYEAHLFSNMTALLWMGTQLEASMGSARFASMVAALLGLSQGISLLMCKGLLLLGEGTPYYVHHAVGFSGVVFAMKVVLLSTAASPDDDDDDDDEAGIVVSSGLLVMPPKYLIWAELLLTHFMVPNSYIIGHLGGILAGYVYLGLNRFFAVRSSSNNRRRPAITTTHLPPRYVRSAALHVKALLSRTETYRLFNLPAPRRGSFLRYMM